MQRQIQLPDDCLRIIYAAADIETKVALRKALPDLNPPKISVPPGLTFRPLSVQVREDTYSAALWADGSRGFNYGFKAKNGKRYTITFTLPSNLYRIERAMCSECASLTQSVWTNAATDIYRPGWYVGSQQRQRDMRVTPNNFLGIICENYSCEQNFTYCAPRQQPAWWFPSFQQNFHPPGAEIGI